MKFGKFGKIIFASTLVTTFIIQGSSGVFAAEDGPDYYIPYDGYAYDLSSKNTYLDIDWRHVHRNPGSATDTVTHTVSRTKSTSASVSTTASFNAMVSEVGIGAEVGWGSSDTVSTSITYSIPGYTTYELRYGSRAVKTTGYEVRYSNGRVASKKWVSGNWTYTGYSDKVKQ
ncbi:hypothetical protein VBD025_08120 [Virgibacillus flavescens]|uniref:hypothetical protein n=1 Tax=Virgibacillus flavescens TaxID=1611422 RepID=UPI003D34BE54